jgi:tetratricopeptide (TPR) repeat protein
LAEKAVAASPEEWIYIDTLGAALYRCGRFEMAVQTFEEVNRLGNGKDLASSWLFLAMAHHRLGHLEEGRKWLNKAVQAINQSLQKNPANGSVRPALSWEDRLELELVRREAETLFKANSGERQQMGTNTQKRDRKP